MDRCKIIIGMNIKKQVSTIQQPIPLKQFSDTTMDMRCLSQCAISKGKKIQELYIEKQKRFIHE